MTRLRAATTWLSWLALAGLVVAGWLFGNVVGWLVVGVTGASLWPLTVFPILGVAAAVWLWLSRRRERAATGGSGGMLSTALTYGMVGGAIGFGAILVWSAINDANQGPLLGIFVTGPAGFLIGCVVGLVRSRAQVGRPAH